MDLVNDAKKHMRRKPHRTVVYIRCWNVADGYLLK